MNNKFLSSLEDWYFCRFFCAFTQVSSGVDPFQSTWAKKGGQKRLLFVMLPLLIIFIFMNNISQGFLQIIFLLLAIPILPCFFIISFYKVYQHIKEMEECVKYPSNSKDIHMYTITSKGIMMNYYNDDTLNPEISWDDIESMELTTVHFPHRRSGHVNGTLRKFHTYIEKVKKRGHSFEIEPQFQYSDRYSLALNHGRFHHQSILPIPQGWLEDGTLLQFIQEVESVSNKKVKPYPTLVSH